MTIDHYPIYCIIGHLENALRGVRCFDDSAIKQAEGIFEDDDSKESATARVFAALSLLKAALPIIDKAEDEALAAEYTDDEDAA
ncbi:hypothetical protein HFO61_30350 [Rhizobium leguminosarum]|uniref:hypothetical protein n=1 Tax=Rhizobium leguminosarum TaxID=384 RepID=UPI001C94F6B5|nr:hypothetical protein [Rhizobium leguminosarum]MBY5551049.1 hypothetical protein [Rhizobium leguminosarum]